MILCSWIRNLLTPTAAHDLGTAAGIRDSTVHRELPCPSSADRPATRARGLEVAVRDLANEVVVCLKGQAGYLEAEVLDVALLPLSARRPPLVTFDLSELCLISSLALGILVGYHRRALRSGTRVRFTAHQPHVREVIEQTRLTMLLEEHDVPG